MRQEQAIGSVLFLSPGHALASHGTGAPVKAVRCMFEPEYFERMTAWNSSMSSETLIKNLDIKSTTIRMLLMRIMDEAFSPGFGSDALTECLCGTLAIEWARGTKTTDSKRGDTLLTRRQLNMITEGLHDLTRALSQYRRIGRSMWLWRAPLHFCRIFKRLTNQTITDYLASSRIENAQSLYLIIF